MNLASERIVPHKYDRSEFYFEHIKRYQFCKPYIHHKTVVDLGCGVGYGAYELVKLGARKIFAFDISSAAIKYAQEHYQHPRITFQNASIDVVVSFEVIEHIKDYRIYIEEVYRILKKGGIFIVSTPNALEYRAATSAYHQTEFTAQELKRLLTRYKFKITMYGQHITDKAYVKAEKDYFRRYQRFTFGGSKVIKKMLFYIPASIKYFIYTRFWLSVQPIQSESITINRKNIAESVTLICVCKK